MTPLRWSESDPLALFFTRDEDSVWLLLFLLFLLFRLLESDHQPPLQRRFHYRLCRLSMKLSLVSFFSFRRTSVFETSNQLSTVAKDVCSGHYTHTQNYLSSQCFQPYLTHSDSGSFSLASRSTHHNILGFENSWWFLCLLKMVTVETKV